MDVLTGSMAPELSPEETALLTALHTRYMARIPRTPSAAAAAVTAEVEAREFESSLGLELL